MQTLLNSGGWAKYAEVLPNIVIYKKSIHKFLISYSIVLLVVNWLVAKRKEKMVRLTVNHKLLIPGKLFNFFFLFIIFQWL